MIANIYIILFDYGFNYKLTKEMAQNLNHFDYLMQRAFKLKIFLSITGLLLFYFLFTLNIWSERYFWIILLLILSSVFVSFANDLNTPFRVLGKFKIETIHYSFYAFFLIGFSLNALHYYGDLFSLSLAFLFSRFLFFIISFISVYKLVKVNVFSNLFKNMNIFRELKEGFPYAMQIGSSVLMVSIDTLILERFASNENVGIYQAGIKIVVAATFFISVIQNVLLPKYSNTILNNKKLFLLEHNRYTKYSLLLGCLITIGILIGNSTLIEILFGENFNALQDYLLGFGVLIALRYFALTHGLVLTVSGNQYERLYSTFSGNISIFLLGLILIPKFQIRGALIASILSHLLMYGMYFYYSRKEISK